MFFTSLLLIYTLHLTFVHYSSPPPMPMLQAQGFFMPSTPSGYFDSPPFSPSPMVGPFMYSPYFNPQYGYMPPQMNFSPQLPPLVPYNAAN